MENKWEEKKTKRLWWGKKEKKEEKDNFKKKTRNMEIMCKNRQGKKVENWKIKKIKIQMKGR